jgi:hypothetical protein
MGTCSAQGKEWIALPLGPSQDLVTDSNGDRTARFSLKYADAVASAPPSHLQVRVLDVSSKDGRSTQLAKALQVTLLAADANHDMALEAVVPKDAQGVYSGPLTVSLRVSPDFSNAALAVQTITLTLMAPTPQIQADTVVVGQERGFLFVDLRSNNGALHLVETTGKAAVHDLFDSVHRDTPRTGQPDDGEIIVTTMPTILLPNNSIDIPISVSGTYPLGKTTGKIELRSKDLASSLVVPYEVYTRTNLSWIVVIAALGSLVGYFVRVALVARQTSLGNKLAASRVLEIINQEVSTSDDNTYRTILLILRARLERSLKGESKPLPEETKAVQDDLNSERTRVEQRLQPLLAQAAALQSLVNRQWNLPEAVQNAFASLKATTEDLNAKLERRNADDAKKILDSSVQRDLLKTVNASLKSGSDCAQFTSKLSTGAPPLVDSDQAMLKQVADSLAKRYPQIAPDASSTTLEQLTAELTSLTEQRSVICKLLDAMPSLVNSFVTWSASELGEDASPVNAAFGKLMIATKEGLNAAQLRKDLEATQIESLAARLSIVRNDWLTYFENKASNADKAKLKDSLSKGAWQESISLVKAAIPKEDRVTPTSLGTLPAGDQPPEAGQSPQKVPSGGKLPEPDVAPAIVGSTLRLNTTSILVGSAAEQIQLQRGIAIASFAQSAIMGAIFIGGVFFLYEDSWVGTSKEMLSLFVLAFGVDLTADSVLAALRKGL